ncbi:tyrosine-type recombinase/integrase [Helicobacter sp. 11S02629-2]|uniref:tyrosine-type recombinase/integrase n=1 Tax=Helicobacter sp. 11S02629-2 TaxID=1476195 RepID=UPI000BA59732|nr:tyrosine-type recombinase/integrase [Helicobacter sp. 11S02629-2]PAF43271.1 hypothetical protein BKH40_07150 [Helicobacter sp. 11S02629-2]
MNYPLDFSDDFPRALRFWIERFLYYKLTSLASYKVKDNDLFLQALQNIQSGGKNNIEKIVEICRTARLSGLLGITTYMVPLKRFYDYCTKLRLASMEDISEDLAREFMSITTSHLKLASQKNYRTVLLNFLKFIEENNYIDKEAGKFHLFRIKLESSLKKYHDALPDHLDDTEIRRFLESLENYQNKIAKNITRDKLLVKIIIYSGARISEVLGLKINDIFEEGEYFRFNIIGKGNKNRIVYMQAVHIRDLLHRWLGLRANIPNSKKSKLLFITGSTKSLNATYAYRVVQSILINAGIRKLKNGPHMLRHSFATLLYKKSKDLILVQETLGHSSVETSRIYTHFDRDNLKYGADLINPKSNRSKKG